MFSLSNMPSSTTVLSTYTSIAGSMMLFRSISNEIIPHQIRSYISSIFQKYFFNPTTSSSLTLIIEEFFDGYSRNEVYEATEIFLRTKITPAIDRLIITKAPRDVKLSVTIERGQEIIDVFQGIQMKWSLVSSKKQQQDDSNSRGGGGGGGPEHKSFELSFQKRHKDFVLESYMPYVLNRAKILKEENRVLKLHTLGGFCSDYDNSMWGSINLEHPTTFDKLAMDPNMKKELIEDLDRFVRRRDFYKKVGKAWKRGYLLYGPPGTGKSSLIAAMANYLHFDVFDLELGNVYSNTELRRVFVATNNRSIVVIEDIDCTTLELHDRSQEHQTKDAKLTLSGLLNFIDGLWSSCGDERIIVFTTNHKDRLDPALLRPGRMDMHIHMSYCTFDGFKLLASNYLSIDDHHELLKEIEILMEDSQITPAEIAEELMKSDDADIALGSVVKLLKKKNKETERTEGGGDQEEEKETQEKENETRSN